MANPNDVFNTDPVIEPSDDITADALVGEGKKYRDANELAKGYDNAERHLMELRRDNAQMREELELLKANTNNRPNTDEGNRQPDPVVPTPDIAPKDEKEFRNRLREEMENFDQEKRALNNMEAAARRIADHFGDPAKANEAVRRRAEELGVSVDWLRDSAARSPEAFYATMGLNNPASPRMTPTPRSDVRFDRQDMRGEKKYSDYQELRRTDKRKYFSPEVQREMQEQAKKLGPAFFNT